MGKQQQGKSKSRNNYRDETDGNSLKNGHANLKIVEVKFRNEAQSMADEEISQNELTFLLGPAGTAKSFLACHDALQSLKEGDVDGILLVRPAVTSGEDLGFLPGNLDEKLDPYMRPLLDNIQDLIGVEKCGELMADGVIKFMPLGYMRGRTFKNKYVLLDEMQNATKEQLRLALTRLGDNSVCVVTADPQQCDLVPKENSCTDDIVNLFKGQVGIGYYQFGNRDIVRSKLVKQVLQIYEKGNKVQAVVPKNVLTDARNTNANQAKKQNDRRN